LKTCDEKQLYVQNIRIKTAQIQGSADGQRLLQTFEAQFVAGHLVKKGHSEIPLLHRLHKHVNCLPWVTGRVEVCLAMSLPLVEMQCSQIMRMCSHYLINCICTQ
jgi:hypothetical protein